MSYNSELSAIDRRIQEAEAEIKKAEEKLAKLKRGRTSKIIAYAVATVIAMIALLVYSKVNPTIDGVKYWITTEKGFPTLFFGKQYAVAKIDGSMTEVEILPEVNGKPVVRLSFSGNHTSFRKISIPDSIIYVGSQSLDRLDNVEYNEYDNALYLGNDNNPYLILVKARSKEIETCIVHDDTKYIYYNAFAYVENLDVVTLGKNVIEIGDYAFYKSGLNQIVLPQGLKRIGASAFNYTDLKHIDIPNTVEEIGNYAFVSASIYRVKVPSSVKKMGLEVFQDGHLTHIYCEAASMPEGWDKDWIFGGSRAPNVYWGHKCQADEWKNDNDGNSVLRCKECEAVLDKKSVN